MNDRGLVLTSDDGGGIRLLTLNRPEQLNAFDQALCQSLIDAVVAAEHADVVKVVVLTGRGRAFSAGTDLVELAATGDFRGSNEDPVRFERLVDALMSLSKPLICAVNGLGIGIGATLLGLADLVVMAESARLRCPFTSLGLVPEAGSSVTFPLLLGRQAAAWVLLSSEWIDAAEAKDMGLAWKVVPDDAVVAVALDLATRLAVHPLASLAASKRLLSAAFEPAVAAGRTRENAAFDTRLGSPESLEALAAFVDGRDRSRHEEPHD